MSPERFKEVSKAVDAWEQEFRKGTGDDNWRPVYERLVEYIIPGATKDDMMTDLLADRILLKFEVATGIHVEELIDWYPQTLTII
ncbi:MAG: hypothetical protein A3C50_03275 [Candidatus Staskawiczbacteria bacterium RIFCSPHIGHO2_02_FULL_43_16]|uniref:Uncharacterized protein n=1 Tax=Candidatus Staskawiczbacteria bacterium RIFCSPHIGHO2_01_FULL_41_41 TaxID=1802203 RepID=A0A1G2HU72_9BACT|nr:MAG: hypothetical protein A2822_03145 [Candidatus Staskawiczbacteria bacterium RIFCSPHIGHO2_01_FULL_41_41]OGZ68722.1 MAG: hypothetical protein A3C50_03275 [Candidatus Staskawiczbacteria bacterium RIFCSPHIGHO2_02_FULL_43_16]OGZ75185.1 MAG: hypothetical protein A3A12_01200 [Candidatus Staskawiczbacteria bacterium RIFCSPLOWO2_01_FULL_43_17b]